MIQYIVLYVYDELAIVYHSVFSIFFFTFSVCVEMQNLDPVRW